MEKGNKKIINAWCTYDLANSVYNLVITATIFPIYFKIVTPEKISILGSDLKNTTVYDFALAFAYLIIACIIPLLSGIADYGGNKKRFMQFFCYLGGTSCALMYFFTSDTISLGIILAILACMGWAGSLVFYNAYLPEIAKPEQHDNISARGFSMGYWGSAVLLIVALILIMTRENDAEKPMMMRYTFLAVGIWWIGFAQIPFTILPNNVYKKKVQGNKLTQGYKELRKVWSELKSNRRLYTFLPAFFTYSMGVQTVMLVANHFGSDEIGMESSQLITTILILQFLAMAGAYLFSFLSSKKGNLFTLKTAVVFWSLICVATYFLVHTANEFYIIAACVGLVMGGIQALSRSTYSKMLPETEDNSSYFSFYDVCEKLSIVLGLAVFGIINQLSATMRTPILALITFFILGFILLLRVPYFGRLHTSEKNKNDR